MENANSNCKGDKIVWTKANCSGTTIISGAGDGNGVCVPLKDIVAFSSVIGSRYSQVTDSIYLLM